MGTGGDRRGKRAGVRRSRMVRERALRSENGYRRTRRMVREPVG